MTIPIVPGPFSFLANVGEGIGGYLQNKEKKRQDDFQELVKKYQTVYEGVKDGILPRSTLSSKETTGLLSQIMEHPGMAPLQTNPSPEETLGAARNNLIPGQIANLDPAGQQSFAATGQLPTAVQAKKETITADQLGGQLTQAQKSGISGVPSAQGAQAAEQKTVDPAIEAIADRHVQTLYNQNHRLPTAEEAFQEGWKDPNATAYSGQLTKEFYGQAIERQRRQLADEEAKRLLAKARADANNDPNKFLTRVTAQLENVRKQRENLAAQLDPKGIVALVTRAKAEGKTRQQMTEQIQGDISFLDAQINSLQQQFGNAAGASEPGATATPGLLLPSQRTSIITRIKANPKLAAQIDKDVASGKMSTDDAKFIKDAIRK